MEESFLATQSSASLESCSPPPSHWDPKSVPTLFWKTRYYQRGINHRTSLLNRHLKQINFYEPKLEAVQKLALQYSAKYQIKILMLSSLDDLCLWLTANPLMKDEKIGFIILSNVGHYVPFVLEKGKGKLFLYLLDTLNYIGAKSATPEYNLMSIKSLSNFNIIDFHQAVKKLHDILSLDIKLCIPYFAGKSLGIRQADNISCGIDALILLKDFLRIKYPRKNLRFCDKDILHSIVGDINILPFKFPALLCKTTQRDLFLVDHDIRPTDPIYPPTLIDVAPEKQTILFFEFQKKHSHDLFHRKVVYSPFWIPISSSDNLKSTNCYLMEKGRSFYERLKLTP